MLNPESVARHDAIKRQFVTQLNDNCEKLRILGTKLCKTGKGIIAIELATNLSGAGIGGVAAAGVLITIITGGTAIPVAILGATAFGVGVAGAGAGVGGILTDKFAGSKEIIEIYENISNALQGYSEQIAVIENDILERTRLRIENTNKTGLASFLGLAGKLVPMSELGAIVVKKTGEVAGIFALRVAGDVAEAGAQMAARNVFAITSALIGVVGDSALAAWNIYRFRNSPSPKAKTLQTKIENFGLLQELIENDVERRKIVTHLLTFPYEPQFNAFFDLTPTDFNYIFS